MRGVATWVSANKAVSGVLAFLLVGAVVTFAVLTNRDDASELAGPGPLTEEASDAEPSTTDDGLEQAGDDAGTATKGEASKEKATIPGLADSGKQAACTPRSVDEVGVTDDAITIGQIVTDSNQLPQQLRPAHEGLQAFVKLFNANGGLCGRKLQLEYRNDNLNPAIHAQDARELANRVLAFVANESLLDQLDYEQNPPFAPRVRGGGGFVPDVGGLAFSYARSQSAWHAGVVGSVSPTLVGGDQYRYFAQEARDARKPCTKGAVIYLQEPTGASEEQARVGQVSIERSWGAGLGRGNTRLYATGLLDSVPQYEALVGRMVADGMNCAFAYTDLQSSVNLAKAMSNRGVWPPSACKLGNSCFRVTYVPLSAYDSKFVRDAGDAALGVSTFIPHVPLTETSNPAMEVYLDALTAIEGARPSTFSIFGFASGLMLIDALSACPEAPSRGCLMAGLRKMSGFSAGGLLGGTTPFRTTRVTFDRYGTFDWKWIFSATIGMRVAERNGKRDFYRINPDSGFNDEPLKIARGTAA